MTTPQKRSTKYAQQFVVVGDQLKRELEEREIFTNYFKTRTDQLKYLEDISQFNISQYENFDETLFIVKHFDFDPNPSPVPTIAVTDSNSSTVVDVDGDKIPPTVYGQENCTTPTNNGYSNNNNHIANPNLARVVTASATIGEESEIESVGYTTDYDDDDQPMQVDPEKSETPTPASDYDGGYTFQVLASHKCCIMGPMALLQSIRSILNTNTLMEAGENRVVNGENDENEDAKEEEHERDKQSGIRMVPSERPLHNQAMQNIVVTFSKISKQEAQQLLTLTRYMGAQSREDVTSKKGHRVATHLVAGNSRGDKYRLALELGLFIMSTDWVRESYRLAQEDIEFEATLPEIVQHYKFKPFHGLHMAFVGFKEEDAKELSELTLANEGLVADHNDLSCTHIVVDAISGTDDTSTQLLSNINQSTNAKIVYKEWFWASLEMEGKAYEEAYAVPGFRACTPRRASKARRTSTYANSSFNNLLSPMLDYSRSPDSMLVDRSVVSRSQSVSRIIEEREVEDLSKITARHRACLELLQTEKNYVRILETIVTLFKVPLENPDTATNEPILPMTDIKIIFGNLMPIYEVHKKMLEDLHQLIEAEWKETNCIGKVFVAHAVQLIKAYPPFVNFFEDTKKTINTCDAKYPRFHAFLKRCQSRIECRRESLTEMLIRPVQRLPSISLLINELIKRTDDSNPDKKYLIEALEYIKRVMDLINEDKRKTEGQIAMFDIVNNIEDCPPNLLSALRRFVCKVEARLLFMNSDSEVIPSKSHKVVLFLFSDLIEICKVRTVKRSLSSKGSRINVPIRRGLNSTQANKFSSNSHKKDYRHLDELRLCDIMTLYKTCQSPEMQDAFVIQARPSQRYDQNFRYYPFLLDDDSLNKDRFIQRLEECILTCDDPEQVSDYKPRELPPIANREIDFGFANSLVSSMEKSRLSRVLSIRQSLLSPSLKSAHRNLALHYQN